VFTLAPLGAGLAGDGAVLLAARATQGFGAALLSPAALSIITITFHGRERHRALAVWSGIGGTGAAVGVLLGGLLASGPGWEWVFFVLSSLLLQRVLGLSALRTGLVFLPVAAATIVGAQAAAHLLGRLGGRPVAATGFAFAAAGMALLPASSAGSDVFTGVLPGFALAAAGLGMAFVTATTTAMSRVDPDRAGMVSGVVNTAHELGAALGVAIVSAIAGASVDTGSAVVPVAGFGDAFLACAIIAVVVAAAAAWLLPPGRPATGTPVFAH
jgi:MFS family permease